MRRIYELHTSVYDLVHGDLLNPAPLEQLPRSRQDLLSVGGGVGSFMQRTCQLGQAGTGGVGGHGRESSTPRLTSGR
jgi:hypothetical protein